jgi:hypothetical protein
MMYEWKQKKTIGDHDKLYHGSEPENMREFTEFIRRLTIPYDVDA